MRTRAAVALLVPALVAGCGGGLSKSELVAKGDAICARVNKQIAKEPDPKTAADLERLAQRTVEISGPAIKDMEALEPPGELEGDFDKFVASLKRQRDLTQQIGEAAGDGDTAKVQRIGAEAQKAVNKILAEANGLSLVLNNAFTAEELMAKMFPEPKWIVPGVLPEGATILAGSPKTGKSWMALGIGVAVASQRFALLLTHPHRQNMLLF